MASEGCWLVLTASELVEPGQVGASEPPHAGCQWGRAVWGCLETAQLADYYCTGVDLTSLPEQWKAPGDQNGGWAELADGRSQPRGVLEACVDCQGVQAGPLGNQSWQTPLHAGPVVLYDQRGGAWAELLDAQTLLHGDQVLQAPQGSREGVLQLDWNPKQKRWKSLVYTETVGKVGIQVSNDEKDLTLAIVIRCLIATDINNIVVGDSSNILTCTFSSK